MEIQLMIRLFVQILCFFGFCAIYLYSRKVNKKYQQGEIDQEQMKKRSGLCLVLFAIGIIIMHIALKL